MTVIEKVRVFLIKSHDISIGYRELNFLTVDNLDKGQIGYSIDSNNNSLTTGQDGDWREEWLVIGTDDMGDPIFIDTSSKHLQVLTAMHGEGEWEPIIISNSLDMFKEILIELKKISLKRTSPNELEKNPITEKEHKQFIQNIKKTNSDVEIEYWENLLSDE